jgi:hypothetical protein
MADKRINALANTAPSTASDDFIAVDGTTNGTRKLNAFSPTFGGNATVTGTLTVSGTSASTFAGDLRVDGGSKKLRLRDTAILDSNYDTFTVVAQAQKVFSVGVGSVSGTPDQIRINGETNAVTLSGALTVSSTTASTTTSSGALVVGNGTSGGLGVGGAINAGGPITTGSDGSLVAIYVPGDSAVRAAAGKLYLDTRTTDGGDIVLRPRINAALTLAAATSNATFGGSITTLAPTGGTAAAWKLGTVATVSPTSPNRTIEVDIGGTIYYIHAKTTNN